MRSGRLLAVAGLLAGSLGAVIGIHSGVAGACPVPNNDGTIWGTDASVTPIGADVPRFFDVDGDGVDDVTRPGAVPDEQWPGDTNGVAHDERHKTVYLDDRDFTGTGDDTLGPGQSPTEATLGQNIHVVDSKAGDEEGIWIYVESNGVSDLQRGGTPVVEDTVWETYYSIPKTHVPPIVVLPPDQDRPVLQEGLTLFPQGLTVPPDFVHTDPELDPCSRADPDTMVF